jgi:hypothetical protein
VNFQSVLRWLVLLAWNLSGIAYASSGTVALGTTGAAPALLVDGKAVALLSSSGGRTTGLYQMYRDNQNRTIAVQVTAIKPGDPFVIEYAGGGWKIRDEIKQLRPRLFQGTRSWTNRTDKEQEAVLTFELERPDEITFFMIPGVSYNGNQRWEKAGFRGLANSQMSREEASDSISRAQWVVAGDRSSLPACTITEGKSLAVGLYAAPADASASACSLEGAPTGGMVQRLWWPWQEQPHAITGRNRAVQAPWETEFFRPGDSHSHTFFMVVADAPEPNWGFGAVLDEAWRQLRHDLPPRRGPKELWDLGIRFARESLWIENKDFTGFSFSLEPRDGGFYITTWPWRFEIGFVGQAAALGAFMAHDFITTKNEESWRKAEASLDFWAKNGRYPNGLIVCRYDDKLAWKEDPELSVRNLGDGAYFYLLAAEFADQAGRSKSLWRDTGLGICDFFVKNILANGTFGKNWKASGVLTDPNGTLGIFVVPALVKAYRMTGRIEYLKTAERSYRTYADGDLAAVCLTGGAIDADTIDKETGLPFVTAGLDLYEITKDAYYLKQAERAGYYLASWQYHYSIDFPKGSPADVMKYDSLGGTSVGVGGGGADGGGAIITLGWLRLAKATGKDIWRDRALITWNQGTIGISDGTLKLNGKVLPAGAQNEGVQHSRSRRSYSSRQGYGNEWLCAWMTAFRLWTLHHWPDWKDFEPAR